MRVVTPALAGALASLYAASNSSSSSSSKNNNNHANFILSPSALGEFEQAIIDNYYCDARSTKNKPSDDDLYLAVAYACLRRKTYQVLSKFNNNNNIASPEVVEQALEQIPLTKDIQEKIMERRRIRYNNNNNAKNGDDDDSAINTPPKTWKEELEFLQDLSSSTKSSNPKEWLWKELLNHPMTEYIPVHCPECGHVVPDSYQPGKQQQQQADAQVGLVEKNIATPTEEEEEEEEEEENGNNKATIILDIKSGWFRGPRGPVIFEITCTNCQHKYQWYRSGHPTLLLDPSRGRLCGEQEDLRLCLANYLGGIQTRIALPLDWDHIWTEFQMVEKEEEEDDKKESTATKSSSSSLQQRWQVEDDSARNFACRLEEGIGSWTGVLAIHPNPDLCEDVTEECLTSSSSSQQEGGRGRIDACHDDDAADNKNNNKLNDYRSRVYQARMDETFQTTQAKTGVGYIIQRAGLSSEQITNILQQAATDYRNGTIPWWAIGSTFDTVTK